MDQNIGSNRDYIDENETRMRRLAERPAPTGRARLALSRREARGLEALIDEARRLQGADGVEDEALSRLAREGRVIGTLIRRAQDEGGARLPAWEGVPRALRIMERLVSGGETALSREALLGAVEAFDAAQPLTMAELWAVPQALRIALARALLRAAGSVVARGRACARAARWVQRNGRGPVPDDPAFIEHALKRAGEDGVPEARARLEAWLLRRGRSPEDAANRAQADRARDALRLENLLSTKRMLDGLNWQACFRALSLVDKALRRPEAGVYARMDDDSRAAVREQVAALARRLRLPELAVARYAVDAARQGEGARGDACWWLYDDEGRAALKERVGRAGARLQRMVPDPSGRGVIAVHVLLVALLALGLTGLTGMAWLFPACALLGWNGAGMLIGRFYPKLFHPARLLKLELDSVPEDCRTLVAMPVLLSSPERVEAVCDQLEALGCLERDENIEYLLLGDFADAPRREMPGDEEILKKARERVAAMNARAGREKYALLHRERALLAADGVWMGWDRKRGALTDLNRLLVGEAGAEAAFGAEGVACGRLAGRFRYVLTLDADTRLLPGEVRRLIGAMAHPLNGAEGSRGYAVLQPRMEPLPSACVNGFVKLFAGLGGLNAYPVAASNLWQDMTGWGIYAGKGIYDVRAFHERLDGALPEGRVLSHDLIEGAVAGAGFLGDVALYDGFPTTLSAFLRRLHRWTRGDWQLLPFLASGRLAKGAALSGADRFRMLDNLVRSLRAPSLLLLLIAAMWTGGGGALLAVLLVNWLEPLLNPREGRLWRRATAELAVLPVLAWCSADAIIRTLWRLGFSGRHLLDWVTAADAEKKRGRDRRIDVPGRAAALLLLPGLLVPGWALGSLGLAALFWIGPGWVRDMEEEPVGRREPLSGENRAYLLNLARDTWRFFEATAPLGGCPLPPDNVQLDPPVGPARRTSPTNIALYMLSCLSATRLGFIGVPEARARLAAATEALEGLEKWRGHLYNWIDIDAMRPLRPRYVSSVDSGNLAAALLLCATAPEVEPALAARMARLAEGMDFTALYDGDKELFAIGVDAETGRMSASHYDLLASEARILSYVSMMLGQASERHWRRLGRPCAAVPGGVAPLSWSGTMFEYLMPALFLDAPENTLLGDGIRAAVSAQIDQGRRLRRPWGVSESGYSALDAALNYQYRAFGLSALALDGESEGDVVAPYAAALAAMIAPNEAAGNLGRMEKLGWRGEWGFYEAADYRRPGPEGEPGLVKSHMAHHQGMALCALCEALTGDSLRRDFMAIPQARSLSLLLEERPCKAGPRAARERTYRAGEAPRPRLSRTARAEACAAETHLLFGGGATALYTADGAVHYARFGVDATRFFGDLQERPDRACVHLREMDTDACIVLGGEGSATRLEPGIARAAARLGRLEAEMAVCVSPEDGTLLRVLELRNAGERTLRCAVTDAIPVALARGEDYRAHPAFQNLFVESARLGEDGLLLRRRPGSRGAEGPRLAHMMLAEGPVACETDYEKLVGREGDGGRPGGVAKSLTGSLGATLNPASALQTELTLKPGQRARVVAALSLLAAKDSPQAWRERWHQPGQPERALRLAGARARAMLGFIGLTAGQHHVLQRMAALLVDGRLAAQARGSKRGEGPASREALWPLGLSGEGPMLAMSVRRTEEIGTARELIRAHEFYRAAGLRADLVLIDDGEAGYARPLRDALEAQIAASHLNALRGEPGGAWLLDGAQLTAEQRRALRRGASAAFAAGGDLYAQARALLAPLEAPRGEPPRAMLTGASTLRSVERELDNGLGGFLPEGGYCVDVRGGALPPAPWCNILANEAGGLLLTERGGGFFWRGNSRMDRLTTWTGDPLNEGWGLTLYLVDERGECLRLLPGKRPQLPFRARYDAGAIRYAFEARRVAGETRFAMHPELPEAQIEISLENKALRGEALRLVACVDWLMGADARDAAYLNTWHGDGACFASGAMEGVGWLAALDAGAMPGPGRLALLGRGGATDPEGLDRPARGEGWALFVPLRLRRSEKATARLVLGWSPDAEAAERRVNEARGEALDLEQERGARHPVQVSLKRPHPASRRRRYRLLGHLPQRGRLLEGRAVAMPSPVGKVAFGEIAGDFAERRMRSIRDKAGKTTYPREPILDTPDAGLNHLFNDFLFHQVRASRVLGRTGFYQPGGAWGFRDQLQDMLALLHSEPERARAHLLRCAGHQFESGDVMHWWHEPFRGVRTRISDDLLFLPWVAAAYVKHTGDRAVLDVEIPYLEDAEIPEGQADVYRDMRPGTAAGTLHDHCMRAFRRAARTGSHGLLLMGAGDWNDAMDRVGAAGKGESVWLTQFAIACADAYREVAPGAEDRAWLEALARSLRIACEVHGWDGGWYLRAYADDGAPLGSANSPECRIDAISQAWAVLAGLDVARCRLAMDAAWESLVDGERGLIRLLAPPFEGRGLDPGYIRGYPAGIRENGGQYTHGALWLLLALIRQGDGPRAHRALQMLLPTNHADSPEKLKIYRVEPYVMAADVYDRPGMAGRGGWTWYTGSAAWMILCVLELLGYERRGDGVRLSALLGDWPRAGLTLPFGRSRYRLVCEKNAAQATLDGVEIEGDFIQLIDDGRTHTAVFPPRDPLS